MRRHWTGSADSLLPPAGRGTSGRATSRNLPESREQGIAMGDAVSIEYAFANLLGIQTGDRGNVNDADVFRNGSPEALAAVLERAADAIDERTKKARLRAEDPEAGSADARIGVAIDRMRREAAELKRRSKEEGETYQWRVIGDLVSIIASLLEKLEG